MDMVINLLASGGSAYLALYLLHGKADWKDAAAAGVAAAVVGPTLVSLIRGILPKT